MNIDYDKLDNLPYHERLWEKDGRKEYRYRYYTPNKQLADKIFKHSVGKNMSDIQKRIAPLVKNERDSFKTFSNWYLEKYRWHWRKHTIPDYFVDSDNILQTNIVVKPRKKQPLTWQQHYALKQKNRKSSFLLNNIFDIM
jgi:hypothetical protein